MVMDLGWWIAVIFIPVIGGLFWMIWGIRKTQTETNERVIATINEIARSIRSDIILGDEKNRAQVDGLRKELSDYKLEASKEFVAMETLREWRREFHDDLSKINNKLDRMAPIGAAE